MSPCPSEAVLEAMVDERLPPRDVPAVAAHVEQCPACQSTLDRLTEAAALPSTSIQFTSEFEQIVSELKGRVGVETDGPRHPTTQHRPAPTARPMPAVDGYDVLEVLGRGGMAVVYKARQQSLDRLVALKMMAEAAPAEATARFLTEAHAVARLRHPNIVQIHDVGEVHGQPYLALEFVPGGNLDKYIGNRPQPVAWAAEMVEILARAVGHAHEVGIIHRDLKPANILLGRAEADVGPASVGAKIADFGLARYLDAAGGPRATATGAVMGTPSYMAPEQVAGTQADAEPVGPRADIYALGGILYQLLTGRPAFLAGDSVATLVQVIYSDPVPPRRLVPEVPRDLETICLKCLEKEPRHRYATAADLAGDLSRFRAGQPILARPASLGDRAAKWARRHPTVAGLLAAIAVLVSVSLTVVTGLWQRAEREADSARTAQGAAEFNEGLANHAQQESASRQRAAEKLGAELAFERGRIECERGQVRQGLAWFVRALELAESAGATKLDRPIRVAIADWSREIFRLVRSGTIAGPIYSVAFRPDGKVLAVAGNTSVSFWDLESNREASEAIRVYPLAWFKGSPVRHVVWSPDGTRVATASADARAQVFDVASRQRVAEFVIPGVNEVWKVLFSPTGRELFALGENGVVHHWDVATARAIGRPIAFGADRGYYNMALSNDGRLLATGGRSNEVRVWDVPTGEPIGEPLTRGGLATALAFSPAGDRLLVGHREGRAGVYTLGTRAVDNLPPSAQGYRAAAFAPDGSTFAVSTGFRTVAFDARSDVPLGGPASARGMIETVTYSRDGRRYAFATTQGEWFVVALPAARQVGPAMPHERGETTLDLTFSSDGQSLISTTRLGTLRWDPARGQLAHPKRLFYGTKRTSAAVSPDGKWMAIGSYGGRIEVVDLHRWDRVGFNYDKLRGSVACVVWSSDGHRVVGISPNSGDFVLGSRGSWVWDLPFGNTAPRRVLKKLDPQVRAAAALPDGRSIVVGCENGDLVVWDLDDDRPVGEPIRHGAAVTSVAVSADGQRFLTGCTDGSARLWDRAGRLVLPPMRHDEDVHAVAFSPDGQTLLTGGADRTARFWDAATGLPLGVPLRHNSPVTAVVYRPDAQAVATGTGAPAAQVWTVPPPPNRVKADEVRAWVERTIGLDVRETMGPLEQVAR